MRKKIVEKKRGQKDFDSSYFYHKNIIFNVNGFVSEKKV
jgi:hypothetical protein